MKVLLLALRKTRSPNKLPCLFGKTAVRQTRFPGYRRREKDRAISGAGKELHGPEERRLVFRPGRQDPGREAAMEEEHGTTDSGSDHKGGY